MPSPAHAIVVSARPFVEEDVEPLPEPVYALSNFSAANYFATQVGGGEAGSTTPWLIAFLFRARATPTVTQLLAARANGSISAGYMLRIDATGGGILNFLVGLNGAAAGSAYTMTASDIGRLHLALCQVNASGVTLTIDRVARPTGAGNVGQYASTGDALEIGRWKLNPSVFQATTTDLVAWASFLGDPTQAQREDYFDAARALGDLPTTMQGCTAQHKWPDRAQLAQQPAPLTQTVYGAGGWYGTTQYYTHPTAIPGSAAGWNLTFRFVLDALTSYDRSLFDRRNETSEGWNVNISTTHVLTASMQTTDGQFTTRPFLLSQADVGKIQQFTVSYDPVSSTLRLYQGVTQVGADTPVSGTWVAPTQPLRIGRRMWNGGIARDISFLDFAGGNLPLTPAEVVQSVLDSEATGRIVPVSGKQTWHYDPSRDIEAVGATHVPATWLDRIGTDHLTRVLSAGVPVTPSSYVVPRGAPTTLDDVVTRAPVDAMARVGTPSVVEIDTSRDGRRNYGVLGWPSAGNTYLTATGGNTGLFAGSADKGLHLSFRIRPDQLTAIARIVLDKRNNSAANAPGYHVAISAAHALTFSINTTAGDFSSAPYTLTSADLGQLPHFIANYDPVRGVLQLFRDGVQVGADVAVTGTWLAGSQSFRVGRRTADGVMAADIAVFDLGGGDGLRSNTEATEHAADVARTGRMQKIEGRTTELFDLTADVEAAGGVLPTTFANRAGSSTASLTRVASNLQVAQRTERVWSFERTAIMHGVRDLSIANFYSSPIGFAGAAGTPWWISALIRIEAISGIASTLRCIAGRRNAAATAGYNLYTSGTNSVLALAASGGITSPTYMPSAADVGKLLLVDAAFDAAGKAHLWVKRAEVGSGSSAGTYAPADAEPFFLGRRSDGIPADNLTVFGFAAGYGSVSLAQVQAHYDHVMASERMEAMPGLVPAHLYRVLPDGSTAPSHITDLAGSAHLTRAGSPALHAQHARAWA